MRSFVRANQRIRAREVRCVGADGNMVGVIPLREALVLAEAAGLDLVEVAPTADPPVCRVMDFGRFKYEEQLKEKQARKNQHSLVIKEIKFHVNVGDHDLETKVNHIRDFLDKGCKVKLSLTFRGRENAHRELGHAVMSKVLKMCEDICVVENHPRVMGATIMAMIGAKSGKT